MPPIVLGVIAAILYLAAAGRVLAGQRQAAASPQRFKLQAVLIGAMAIILHAIVLHDGVFAADGFNLGVSNSASLVALTIALVLVGGTHRYPIETLGIVLFPAAALALVGALIFPGARLLPAGAPAGLELHIAIAIVAYSLFAIACIQAVFLAFADYKLRHHHPIMHFLPPLNTMENILFQITSIAFVLLTISLVLGAFFTSNVMQQHLAHKIVFSILAWLVFAVLLWGRWRHGWRGARAVRLVIAGSVLLGVGYFGSKIVLELILHRV